MPVYNVDPFLEKCIESIMVQTWNYLGVILVDDGSTDLSGNICDELAQKDGRIKVIHKKNAGVSSARNTGIEASSGGFICFIDGDNYVMPDYIEYMLELIFQKMQMLR